MAALGLVLGAFGPCPALARVPVAHVLPGRENGDARRQAVESIVGAGGRILGPMPDGRLLVDWPQGLPSLRLPHGTALSPADRLAPGASGFAGPLVVYPAPGVDTTALAAAVHGAFPRASVETLDRFVVVRSAGISGAERLARLPEVLAVLPLPETATPATDQPRGLLQSGVDGLSPFHAAGLAGQGEIVAVADSGLSVTCAFEDPSQPYATETIDPTSPPATPATSPLHRKIQAYQDLSTSNFTDEPDTGVAGYHGTLVAAVVAADTEPWAEPPAGSWPDAAPAFVGATGQDGQAPGARLVIQDLHAVGEGPTYTVPANLSGLATAAWRAGARVWNLSFTSTGGGAYDQYAHEVDVATTSHPDLVVTLAAGNVVSSGPGTVLAPSTARNGFSVGNSSTGIWVQDVAPTSAWGPTADGRRKPDACAPGTGINAADGSAACATQQASGTSLASPAAAAAAALVRQYFREGREGDGRPGTAPTRVASSALVRAVLGMAARSLTGGPQQTVHEQPAPSPEQGWGRIVLADALPLPGAAFSLIVHADDDVSSTTDGFATAALNPDTYSLTVHDASVPLVVALSFTDALSLPLATSPVVNDLDLEVRSPGGAVYLGNVLTSNWSMQGGSADTLNSLEIVRVQPPVETGAWTLTVRPADVVSGPQPYALVSRGGTCKPTGAFAAAPVTSEPACGTLVVAAPSTGGTPPVRYALYRGLAPGAENFAAPLATGLPRPIGLDAGLAPGQTAYYVFEATDACGTRTRSPEGSGTRSTPCPADTLVLHVAKAASPAQVALTWNETGPTRTVRRHVFPPIVATSPAVGTSTTGALADTPPPAVLTCWLVH